MAIKMAAAPSKAVLKWQRFYRIRSAKSSQLSLKERSILMLSEFSDIERWNLKSSFFESPYFLAFVFSRFSSETLESWRHRFFQNWRSPGLMIYHARTSSLTSVDNKSYATILPKILHWKQKNSKPYPWLHTFSSRYLQINLTFPKMPKRKLNADGLFSLSRNENLNRKL